MGRFERGKIIDMKTFSEKEDSMLYPKIEGHPDYQTVRTILRLYTGGPPADETCPETGTLIVEIRLNGEFPHRGSHSGTVITDGILGWFRLSRGFIAIRDGYINVSGYGAYATKPRLIMDTLQAITGSVITIDDSDGLFLLPPLPPS